MTGGLKDNEEGDGVGVGTFGKAFMLVLSLEVLHISLPPDVFQKG
jgi:hypothetical protein